MKKRLEAKKNIFHYCKELICKRMSLFNDHEFFITNSNQADKQ